MASSLNRATLIGNLGKDPDIRKTQDGRSIANFSIATSERWKDKQSGEQKEATEWHTIVVFNENLVKVVEQYVKKGMKILVEGQLKTRKWQDKEGKDRYSTEIVLQGYGAQLLMLNGKDEGGGRSDYASQDRETKASSQAPPKTAPKGGVDDEIPF